MYVWLPSRKLPSLSRAVKGYFEPAPVVCMTMAGADEYAIWKKLARWLTSR
ncbi:hypothetical protein D3C72_2210960 [compost metagenome]